MGVRASEASFEFCLSKLSSSAVSDSADEATEQAGLKLFDDRRAEDFLEDKRKDAERSRPIGSSLECGAARPGSLVPQECPEPPATNSDSSDEMTVMCGNRQFETFHAKRNRLNSTCMHKRRMCMCMPMECMC